MYEQSLQGKALEESPWRVYIGGQIGRLGDNVFGVQWMKKYTVPRPKCVIDKKYNVIKINEL